MAQITEHWLRTVGFKPHVFARQPNRHWLLWVGHVARDCRRRTRQREDLGIELSFGGASPWEWWYCWLRTGTPHTPDRFIHLRDVSQKWEVVQIGHSAGHSKRFGDYAPGARHDSRAGDDS